MCLHQRLHVHCHPATPTYPPTSCKKLNKVVDDEALSLTTMKETEWLNHMRQNVEDHQHTQREREGDRGGGGEIQRICNPLLPSKLEMEKPLTRTQQQ